MTIMTSNLVAKSGVLANSMVSEKTRTQVIRLMDKMKEEFETSNSSIEYDLDWEVKTLKTDVDLVNWNNGKKHIATLLRKRFVRHFHTIVVRVIAKHRGNGLLDAWRTIYVGPRGAAKWGLSFNGTGGDYHPYISNVKER